MTAWKMTSAIAAHTEAHLRLKDAMKSGRAIEIWEGNFKHTTCANIDAAKAWIGRSKKYRLIPQRGNDPFPVPDMREEW